MFEPCRGPRVLLFVCLVYAIILNFKIIINKGQGILRFGVIFPQLVIWYLWRHPFMILQYTIQMQSTETLQAVKKVDIQTKVDIVARSGSSDVEQRTYIDTRLECLEDLNVKLQTNAGNDVTDIMRFFHCDSPA